MHYLQLYKDDFKEDDLEFDDDEIKKRKDK